MTTVVDDAAYAVLLEDFERASDLHEWIGPVGSSGWYFQLERWHRSVGKESWRLGIYSPMPVLAADEEVYRIPRISVSVDIADPLFPEYAIAWLREQKAAVAA